MSDLTSNFPPSILADNHVVPYLRLTSGSVWPAVIAHASWNALIQGVFDASTQGAGIWLGESGILVAIVAASLVLVHVRGTWTIKRYPADERARTVRATEM
jgi:hypothetical protein